MKAIVNNGGAIVNRPFPKLMITKSGETPKGRIVLFTSSKKGTVIEPGVNGDNFCIGEVFTDWRMAAFEDLEGSVTLSND